MSAGGPKGTILCYGASNTWGYDSRSYFGEQYPKHVRWPGILDLETAWQVVNKGQNGRQIPARPYEISSFLEMMSRESADKDSVQLWVSLGTNDLLMAEEISAEAVARKMRFFLTQIRTQPPFTTQQIRIRLITPPAMQPGAWVDDPRLIPASIQLNDCYREVADDLGIDFTGTGHISFPMLFDGVHLSEKGHRRFADLMLEVLRSAAGD